MTGPDTRTIYLIKRAEMTVRAGLEAALRDHSITPGQYTIMSLLATRPDQSSASLARKAGVTPQSMSETVAGLERKGLIKRAESPEHKRVRHVQLTRKGRALLAQCEKSVDALEAKLFEAVAPKALLQLRKVLIALIGQDTPADTL